MTRPLPSADPINRLWLKGRIVDDQRVAARYLRQVAQSLGSIRSSWNASGPLRSASLNAAGWWRDAHRNVIAQVGPEAWELLELVVIAFHHLGSAAVPQRRRGKNERLLLAALDQVASLGAPEGA